MGYKIKDVRKSKGITQEQLSKSSGVSRATICALENGTEKNTSTNTLVKIATALGVCVDDIFFAEGV